MNLSERTRMMLEAHPLRDYFYRMMSKESKGETGAVSPTGATGLFQFTKGTGKQYGLVGKGFDRRANADANTKAMIKLTEDNQRLMRRLLGREPSLSELALGHQQGAETAVNMLTGTGNASRRNLAVNAIPPGTSGPEAARRIMDYYGFDKAQVPGYTLSFNPNSIQSIPSPMMAPTPNSSNLAQRIMGTGLAGGKDTPFAGVEEAVKAFRPQVNPQAAAEAARITPMSSGMEGMANSQMAQTLLGQLMQHRRRNYGLSLTATPPMGAPSMGGGY